MYECTRKWSLNPLLEPHLRCRQCSGCRLWLQSEWCSRMMLEAASNPCWPFFFTLTYSDQYVPTTEKASDKARRFPQYCRESGYTIRYFICTELGDATKRIHHHGICWIPEWDRLTHSQIQSLRERVWPYGFSDFSRCRKIGAFRYVAKYVFKKDRFPAGS